MGLRISHILLSVPNFFRSVHDFNIFISGLEVIKIFSCPAQMVGGRVVRMCWVNFKCRGVLLIWIIVRQGPTVLAVGAGGDCLDISLFFLPLSGTKID